MLKKRTLKEERPQRTLKSLVQVVFVSRIHLMRSIRCTDKAVGCNSYTKIKILKPENDSGIKKSLFEVLT